MPKAVAVVVSGQLSRLEIRSKVEHLAQPTEATGARVDFYFVLDSKSRVFVDAKAGTSSDQGRCSAILVNQISKAGTCDPPVGNRTGPAYWCADDHVHIAPHSKCQANFSCMVAGSMLQSTPCPPVDNSYDKAHRGFACSCHGGNRRTGDVNVCRPWSSSNEAVLAMRNMNANLVDAKWSFEDTWERVVPAFRDWLVTPSNRNFRFSGQFKWTLTDTRRIQYNQFYKWRTAALMIERHEQRLGQLYDTVVHMRDDSIVTQPYRVPTPPLASPWLPAPTRSIRAAIKRCKPARKNWLALELAARYGYLRKIRKLTAFNFSRLHPACHVKNCHDWGGVADKILVCARQHMQPLLRAFWDDALLGEPFAPFHANREEHIKRVFDAYQTPVWPMDPEDLPIVASRPPCQCGNASSSPRGEPWCLLSDVARDCHPRGLPAISELFNSKSGVL